MKDRINFFSKGKVGGYVSKKRFVRTGRKREDGTDIMEEVDDDGQNEDGQE